MIGRIQTLRERLRGRDDSEHEQALVRLVIAALILAYLAWLSLGGEEFTTRDRAALWIILAETMLGLGIFVAIVMRPAASPARRYVGMLADYGTLAGMMTLHGAALAPLYIIYLWVTIGNGLRYGPRYLYSAMALASASFLFVIASTPYWQQNAYLSWGLLIGLAAIPAYLASLLRALTRATNEARQANAAKTRFLANMSHEFRSPLNGITGMSDLLISMRLTPEQREAAEVIQTSAQTLLLLVEDVLDISAIEAGKLRVETRDFSPNELVQRIRTMMGPIAASTDIELHTQIDPAVPPLLHGNANHLMQVLLNLVHNAIKFTEAGSVRLEVSVRDAEGPRAALRFSVRDTGIGVPEEARERIFHAFEQVEGGVTRRFGGTGLGTTIAKTLTEMMGGHIGMEPNPGGGSLFWVDLDFDIPVTDQAEGAAQHNIIAFDDPFVRHRARVRPLSILVAEDLAANRTVMKRLLERAGHQVTLVENGEEALDLMADADFDVAIVDLHMPGLSGIDVIKHVRVMQAGGARTPIIALSADATLETIRATEEAGAVAYLTKPVVVPRLLSVLGDVAGASGGAAIERTPMPAPQAPTLRVAVLEELAEMGLGDGFLQQFLDQCVRDAGRCVSDVERAVAAADWLATREAAHALKGVAENLGAQALVEGCGELMRSSDDMLRRDARRLSGAMSDLLEAATAQARREVARLTGEGGRDSQSG